MTPATMEQGKVAYKGKSRAQLERMLMDRDASERKDKITISKKGCVMLRRIRKWGVTYYIEEWEEIKRELPEVMAFIAKNREAIMAAEKAAKNGE